MALGCSTFSLSNHIVKHNFTKRGKTALAIVEILCYLAAFNFACTRVDVAYSYPIIFILWLGVTLSLSGINPGDKIFDRPVFYKLGKASLVIYLNQFYAIRLVQELMADYSFEIKATASTLITFAGAFVCYEIVGWFNKRKLTRKFFIEE